MSRALGVLGTGSDVGKSLVAAGLCRLLYRKGVRVAPFKAQNMSLNSFVTPDGDEMGRAQVLQAEACGLRPHVDMNPILLKPESNLRSQVIVQGKVWQSQDALRYFDQRAQLFEVVRASFDRLAKQFDVIVIEGAGSAAELNLRDRDIVNWPVVELADASVVLVADIDRGGVFAQVIGTLDLLEPEERKKVIGIVINKFRGDARLFEDGMRLIEDRAKVPVLGIIPHLRPLELDQEDSVDVERHRWTTFTPETTNLAVVLLPHMSNFTDFNQLGAESDVALRYVTSPQELKGADVVIVPGSKTTIADLEYLVKGGMDKAVREHRKGGGEIVGICGGFQMLGSEISDPLNVETGGSISALDLLDVATDLLPHKRTRQVRAHPVSMDSLVDCDVEGYEIHMGVTNRGSAQPCFRIVPRSENPPSFPPLGKGGGEDLGFDGAVCEDGLVWGTYIHGVFDQPGFRRGWLNRIRERKGLPAIDLSVF